MTLLRQHRHASFSLAWTWLGNVGWALLVATVLAPFAVPFGPGAVSLAFFFGMILGAFVPRMIVRHWRLRALSRTAVDLDVESVVAALDVKERYGGLILEAGERTFASGELETMTLVGRPHNRKLYKWLKKTLRNELEPLAKKGTLGRVRARYVSHASNPNLPFEPLPFLTIVDRLLAAPRSVEGPTLLVQRNPTDAIIALGSSEFCVLFDVSDGEDPKRTLAARVDAAFEKERDYVRRAVDRAPTWVLLVNGGRPLKELGLTPGEPIGSVKLRPQFLRIEGNSVDAEPLVAKGGQRVRPNARVVELLRRGVQTPAPDLGETQLADLEREGEHLLAAEGDANERTRKSWPMFFALVGFWALLVVCYTVFGGFSDFVVAIPMGALLSKSGLDGEWWRALTAVQLHLGVFHFAGNTLGTLYMWTGLTNAIGGWRTLAIFFVSAVLASVFSILVSKYWGAGASGGVFGLLGALIALSWRRPGSLPARRRRGFLFLGLLILAINVLPSLQATVSTSAHAGGLVVGGLLVWLGVFTVELPPLDAPSGTKARFETVFKLVVLGFACATLGSFALAWQRYRPWEHRWPTALETRTTPTGIEFRVPRGFRPFERSSSDPTDFYARLGEPLLFELWSRPEPLPPEAALEAAKKDLERKGPGKKAGWKSRPTVLTRGGRSVVQAVISTSEMTLRRVVIVERGTRVDVELAIAPGLGAPWPQLVEEITDSVHVTR